MNFTEAQEILKSSDPIWLYYELEMDDLYGVGWEPYWKPQDILNKDIYFIF